MARATSSSDRYRNYMMREENEKMFDDNEEVEIDLIELMRRLMKHLVLILFIAVLGGVCAGLYTHYYITPIYESTAKLYITSQEDSVINLSDLQIGSYLAKDYVELFKTWEVHEMVISNLNLPYTYSQIQNMLTLTNPSDTRILYLSVQSPNAHEAMEIANEYANVATQFISKSLSTEEPNIISLALEPTSPISPNMTRNTLIGFMLGLFVTIVIITIRFLMDDKVRTTDDIWKSANLLVLAVVPSVDTDSQRNHKRRLRRKQ